MYSQKVNYLYDMDLLAKISAHFAKQCTSLMSDVTDYNAQRTTTDFIKNVFLNVCRSQKQKTIYFCVVLLFFPIVAYFHSKLI